jgi:hypothetical protein
LSDGLETLIEVEDDPHIGSNVFGLASIALVVDEIWSEQTPAALFLRLGGIYIRIKL